VALNYKISDPVIPNIDYTDNEKGVWQYCYPKLKSLLSTNACDETNFTIKEMESNIKGFNDKEIPQLQDISSFL